MSVGKYPSKPQSDGGMMVIFSVSKLHHDRVFDPCLQSAAAGLQMKPVVSPLFVPLFGN